MGRRVKRIEEIDRFETKSESGKEYLIIQYQEYLNPVSEDQSNDEILGRKFFLTYHGALVYHIKPKTFEIFATKEIVQKV